jgi:hypothetical protein
MKVNRAITGWYFVRVDLGQSRDFTALAVLEWAEADDENTELLRRQKPVECANPLNPIELQPRPGPHCIRQSV